MKKLIICAAVFVLASATTMAQTTQATTKPAVKPAAPTVVMKNLNDSFSYAAGINIATNMKEQGITNVNSSLMAKAINDVFNNKPHALEPQAANTCLQKQLGIYNEKKAAANKVKDAEDKKKAAVKDAENKIKAAAEKAKGQAFLDQNKTRVGVVALPSGLQYEIVQAGDGGLKPTMNDTVVVNYSGKLIDGVEFDSSTKNGGPITFHLGQVIKGWSQILQLMSKGAHWKVYIPSELGYGDNGYGDAIPPGAVLVFDITLENIKPAAVK